ncbi:Rho GTPase activation protein [Mucor mucedo]|uniref:Rho GTPase activation protein n=1 Tax=Mucor mucedo TaxID=29922 RepID=UPI00222081D3|nr:Rho GTPase activation protein [Mucor mucedo]KAI7895986.1 Rho GTPase activation protein [Mucor mucedo]
MLSSDGYKIETDSIDDGENFQTNPASPVSFRAVQENEELDTISKLGDLDGGFQCLLDKVKQDLHAAKDVAIFLKKRAAIEEEYGKQMIKLAQTMTESYDKSHAKPSTYGLIWTSFLKVHETIGDQRVKFSADIAEVADDVQIMSKDTEKSRKQVKEIGVRHERNKLDSELSLEKSKQKYDMLSEDWERAILARSSSDSEQIPKKGLFKSSKTPAQLKRQVDESCLKANGALTGYKNQLTTTNATRNDYFTSQLPSDIKTLKSVDDECCTAVRYQLARYAYIFEESLTKDGYALDNDEGRGLRSLTEKIDFIADTADLVKDYSGRAQTLKKDDIPYKEYPMSSVALNVLKPYPVFGVDLTKLMQRDGQEVPMVVVKCAEAIEASGLKTVGLYRISGTSTQIQRLKGIFDRSCASVDLSTEENGSDVNNITSLLKLWFRELPDPLFPQSSYQHFMNAAKIENDRMRVLGLHTIINDLPDAHYATLKYIMRHLDKVQQNQDFNKMTSVNLSTIFGITLLGGDNKVSISSAEDNQRLTDTHWHARVIQTILENYRLIFEPDEE